MQKLVIALLLLSAPAWAQLEGFGKEELIKYTAKNPFDRFEDGRPKVPDKYLEMLKGSSSEMLWGPLRGAGYEHQWVGGWQIVHPEKKLVGRAFTAVFMPVRPDLDEVIEADAKAKGLGKNDNQRVIDALQPGDVLVVDLFGKIEGGTFAGDNLSTAIITATGNGYVIDGGVRDLDGIYPQNMPIYVRGFDVSAIKDVMLMGMNVPIRIGGTTVMPGDVVVGDREGLSFIPPHVVEEAAKRSKILELHDIWTKGKLATGKWKASELYPSPATPSSSRSTRSGWRRRRRSTASTTDVPGSSHLRLK